MQKKRDLHNDKHFTVRSDLPPPVHPDEIIPFPNCNQSSEKHSGAGAHSAINSPGPGVLLFKYYNSLNVFSARLCFINIPFALCLPVKLWWLCWCWKRLVSREQPVKPQCFSVFVKFLSLRRTPDLIFLGLEVEETTALRGIVAPVFRNSAMPSLTSTVTRSTASCGRKDVEHKETRLA